MLTPKQVDAYLRRIRLDGPLPRTQDTLTRIVRAHYLHVPYENLDVMAGIPLSLAENDLYDKIVTRHRGGWCFELNAALGLLLEGLGFEVLHLTGRFILGEPEGVLPMRRHRVLLVTLPQGRYLADAGILRESCRAAHPFVTGVEQSDGVASYRLGEDPFYGHILYQRFPGKSWAPMFGFTLEPQIPADFVMPNFFCEKHSSSPFNKQRMAGIRTPGGSCNLIGSTFKTLEGDRVVSRREVPEQDVPQVLRDVFGLA